VVDAGERLRVVAKETHLLVLGYAQRGKSVNALLDGRAIRAFLRRAYASSLEEFLLLASVSSLLLPCLFRQVARSGASGNIAHAVRVGGQQTRVLQDAFIPLPCRSECRRGSRSLGRRPLED
jgi:hypothetical protein